MTGPWSTHGIAVASPDAMPCVRCPEEVSADGCPHLPVDVEMAWECGFRGMAGVGTVLAISISKASFPRSRRTIMKFETLMLQSLFSVCLLICVATVGGMLVA
ncbi:hypothetical protein GCM10028797_29110 [Dyella agri]